MVFPSIIANPGLHDTPRCLYVVQGLGEGTMGRVFLTLDSGTNKLYAMKVFKKDYVSACGEVQNTVAERGILAETRDNLFTVNLHSSFQDEARLFMLLVGSFSHIPHDFFNVLAGSLCWWRSGDRFNKIWGRYAHGKCPVQCSTFGKYPSHAHIFNLHFCAG